MTAGSGATEEGLTSREKITQETSLGWKEALPIALLRTRIAPKEQVGLSPYEMLYGQINNKLLSSLQFSSVTQSCLTLCDPTTNGITFIIHCPGGDSVFLLFCRRSRDTLLPAAPTPGPTKTQASTCPGRPLPAPPRKESVQCQGRQQGGGEWEEGDGAP